MRCSVDGCENQAARAGLCWAHVKRKQREHSIAEPIRPYRLNIAEHVRRMALRYSEADEPKEFGRARDLLMRYARHLAQRRRKPKSS